MVAMTSKTRVIRVSATAGAFLSAALMALSLITHSIWPIMPGIYVSASMYGIHNDSYGFLALAWFVNAALIAVGSAASLVLYRLVSHNS